MSRNVPCTDLPAGETPASRIVSAARQLVTNGMNRGSSGNISIRRESTDDVPEGFFITPSGVDPARMEPDNICIMRMTGENGSTGKPSSEWRIHRDIYAARPDVHAIVHTHSPFATTLACRRQYDSLRAVCPVRQPGIVGYGTGNARRTVRLPDGASRHDRAGTQS